MRKNKKLNFLLCILIFILWVILSPTAFFGNFNQAHEQTSEDGMYRIVAYYVLPTTPVSLFQWVFTGDFFLVLYDKHNNYLGQSSPFGFSDQFDIFGNDIFFPDDADGNEKLFSINGVNDFTEGYTIPVEHIMVRCQPICSLWWVLFF